MSEKIGVQCAEEAWNRFFERQASEAKKAREEMLPIVEERNKRLLENYGRYLSMPIVQDPEFVHNSSSHFREFLQVGDVIEARFHNSARFTYPYRDVEEIFEEVRKAEFPSRPSRLTGVFLWPAPFGKYVLPTATVRNIKNDEIGAYLRQGAIRYAVSVSPESNIAVLPYEIDDIFLHLFTSSGDLRAFVPPREHLEQRARVYWRHDLREVKDHKHRAEVLVDGKITVIGIPPYMFKVQIKI